MTTAFARDIITALVSPRNIEMCTVVLRERFPTVDKLPLSNLMEHFAAKVSRELGMSDPLPGTNRETFLAYNRQFIAEVISLIQSDVPDPARYAVTDGEQTARSNYRRCADDLLTQWAAAPANIAYTTHREDMQSDCAGGAKAGALAASEPPIIKYRACDPTYANCQTSTGLPMFAAESGSVRPVDHFTATPDARSGGHSLVSVQTSAVQPPGVSGCVRPSQHTAGIYPDIAARGYPVQDSPVPALQLGLPSLLQYPDGSPGGCASYTGIDFTDVTEENPYKATYENAYTRAWNDPETNIPVLGDGSIDSDRALLSRRVFRSESGVENGIPFYRRTVQHRHFDRDQAVEGLRGDSRGMMVHRHDMQSLYDRTDAKMRGRMRRETMCDKAKPVGVPFPIGQPLRNQPMESPLTTAPVTGLTAIDWE